MQKINVYAQLFWLLLLLCLPACEENEAQEETIQAHCPQSSFLMEPESLMAKLRRPEKLCLLEVSKSQKFEEAHVPHAQNIWRPDYADAYNHPFGGMRADSQQMGELLRRNGMDQDDELILYDRRGNVDAIRFMWVLETYGFSQVKLLNGGFGNWRVRGLPTESGPATMSPKGNFKFPEKAPYYEPIMEIAHVQQAMEDSSWILLDTRSADEYEGKVLKKGAYRRGRIPTSIHLDWIDMIYADSDHRFKTCDEIEPMLVERGISPLHHIITYCHSGVRSAHMAFVLTEIMGYPYVWNYDGSWTEWSYHEQLPISI